MSRPPRVDGRSRGAPLARPGNRGRSSGLDRSVRLLGPSTTVPPMATIAPACSAADDGGGDSARGDDGQATARRAAATGRPGGVSVRECPPAPRSSRHDSMGIAASMPCWCQPGCVASSCRPAHPASLVTRTEIRLTSPASASSAARSCAAWRSLTRSPSGCVRPSTTPPTTRRSNCCHSRPRQFPSATVPDSTTRTRGARSTELIRWAMTARVPGRAMSVRATTAGDEGGGAAPKATEASMAAWAPQGDPAWSGCASPKTYPVCFWWCGRRRLPVCATWMASSTMPVTAVRRTMNARRCRSCGGRVGCATGWGCAGLGGPAGRC